MKRNAWKKMTKSALSLLLVVSMFAGLGFARPSAYAMDEGTEEIVTVSEPVIEEVTPVVEEATPVVEEAAPVVEEAAPVVEEAAPVVEEAAPVVEEAAPVVEEAAPVVEDAAPVVEEAAPVVEEAVPVVEDAAPVVEEAVPVVEEAAPAAEAQAETETEVEAAAETTEEVTDEIVEEITEEVKEEIKEEVPAVKMGLMKMAAPATAESENVTEREAAPADETGNDADSAEEADDAEDAEEAAEEEAAEEAAVTPAPKYIYYNNGNHDIAINVYEDGKMVCNVQNTEATGEDLAIVQLHDSEGSVISNSLKDDLRNLVTNIVLGEGILGVGWTGYDYYVNPEKTDVFHGFEKLTEVKPSSTLEVIGWSAFRKCFNLVNFDFSVCKNLTTVMRQAFSNTALKSADFSGTQVETIGHGAFENCTELEEVSIPSTVTKIAEQAFYKCDGIQEIEYNAAAYEASTTEKGKENPYLASAIFSASKNNDYSLTIGTDVEVLPRGFFKAVQGAGEISFSAMEDGDDCTVSGRSLAVDKEATFNQSPAPFKTLSTDCVVDENGVLYEKKNDALQITYFSPELTQYTLPKNVQVKDDAIAVANLGDHASSKVTGVVTYKIEAGNEIEGVDAADLPDFKISDTVLVLKNKDGGSSFKPFSAADLTGNAAYSVTVENEDGSKIEYNYSLSGWAMEDGTVLALGEAVALSGEVSLTSVWNLSKEEIPAPAPEKQDEPVADEDKTADEDKAPADEAETGEDKTNDADKIPTTETEDDEDKADAADKAFTFEDAADNDSADNAVNIPADKAEIEADKAPSDDAKIEVAEPAASEDKADDANKAPAAEIKTAAAEEIKADTVPVQAADSAPAVANETAATAVAAAPLAATAAQTTEELNDEAVPMAELQQIGSMEEIAEAATPLAAATLASAQAGAVEEAPETAESHMNLFLIALLVLAIIAVIIFLSRKDKEENA